VANDYIALWKCLALAMLLLAMQIAGYFVLMTPRGWAPEAALGAALGGLFVYGVLVRYFLRLPFGRAVLLTVCSSVSVALMTFLIFVAVGDLTG
jgi:hypothetical protein